MAEWNIGYSLLLSESSRIILEKSGWERERILDPNRWIRNVEAAGFPIFDAWLHVLAKYGGLTINATPFASEPFLINNTKMISLPRKNPILEFLPERSNSVVERQASYWQSIEYLAHKQLDIAPIGLCRFFSSEPYDLFVLSDGTVFGGGRYEIDDNNKVPGIFFCGKTIEQAINKVIEDFLVYW